MTTTLHTEQQIEEYAEGQMNSLDRRYMAGQMTTEEYDRAVDELDKQTRSMMARLGTHT